MFTCLISQKKLFFVLTTAPSTSLVETPMFCVHLLHFRGFTPIQNCKRAPTVLHAEDNTNKKIPTYLEQLNFFVPPYCCCTSMKHLLQYNESRMYLRCTFSLLSGCCRRNRHFLANKLDREQVLYYLSVCDY